jgi:hypothetical protein
LWADSNEVTSIDVEIFHSMSKLLGVWMSKNKLTTLKRDLFTSFSHLEEIWLNENEIVKIEPLTFSQMTSIKLINLAANKLEVIEANIFVNLSDRMDEINLSKNRILKYKTNMFKHLNLLNLSRNLLDGLNDKNLNFPFKGIFH